MTSPLGAAVYGEVTLGQEVFEIEAKLLLEKTFGSLVVVSNTVLESEWEHEKWADDKGVFEQTLGLNHQLSPSFLIGVETLLEIEFDDWAETGDPLIYAGPSASYRTEKWWVTTSPIFQLTSEDHEAGLMWRTLVGIPF